MSFHVLLKPLRRELIEKNSRFIGIACISGSLDEFKRQRAELQREYPDATHITFAYRIQDEQGQLHTRFSDDGEPAGTAGKPILMPLEGASLINTTIFVVRYYGGTNLGAGGLVRAYGQAAKLVLKDAETALYIPQATLVLSFPYELQKQVEYLAKKHEAVIQQQTFAEQVCFRIELPKAHVPAFKAEFPLGVNLNEN